MFCFRDQNYCPLLIVAFHNMVHSYNLLTSSTVSFFKIFYLATLCSPHYSLVFFTLKQYTSINSGGFCGMFCQNALAQRCNTTEYYVTLEKTHFMIRHGYAALFCTLITRYKKVLIISFWVLVRCGSGAHLFALCRKACRSLSCLYRVLAQCSTCWFSALQL